MNIDSTLYSLHKTVGTMNELKSGRSDFEFRALALQNGWEK